MCEFLSPIKTQDRVLYVLLSFILGHTHTHIVIVVGVNVSGGVHIHEHWHLLDCRGQSSEQAVGGRTHSCPIVLG